MRIKGKALKYGDNIDTDAIIPARYLNTTDPKELAKHCMEGVDENFQRKADKGDIIVAGENFGCGSSREHAPLAIKAAGISGVIAVSFARIFYRNAINIGLPIFTAPEAAPKIKDGDLIQIDDKRGVIKNLIQNHTYPVTSFPPFIQEIIASGGLIKYTRRKLSLSAR